MQKHLVIWFAILGAILACAAWQPGSAPAELHEVTFYYEGRARSVCIIGDFNQWTGDSHCLRSDAGDHWSIRLQLPPGPFHYAFMVDGKRWVLDPKALFVENDGFGKQNSVAMIE